MANLPPDPDPNGTTGDDTGVGSDRGAATGTPLWVKVFGIIALTLVLLFVILLLAGGGSHGPGRHSPAGGPGGQTPPVGVSAPGGQQP